MPASPYDREARSRAFRGMVDGADRIRAFYTRRRQHGTITTRHLVSNLRVFRDDERRA